MPAQWGRGSRRRAGPCWATTRAAGAAVTRGQTAGRTTTVWSLLTHISYHSAVKLRSIEWLPVVPARVRLHRAQLRPACARRRVRRHPRRGEGALHGVKLLLSLTELNATSFAETFLFDPTARAAAARNLAQLRRDSGAAGFGFDFEGSYITNATDAAAIVSFFAQIGAQIGAQPQRKAHCCCCSRWARCWTRPSKQGRGTCRRWRTT